MQTQIDSEELERLREAQEKLNLLEHSGVDNWEGYDDAMEPSGLKPCPRCHGTGNSPRKFIGYPHARCELCSGFGRARQQEVENYNKYGHAHL